MSAPKTVIPKGSWVLITGLTGYVASQTAKQFLERGYYVRGTVRDIAKASSLVDGHLTSYKDSGHLELALVPDLGADHAFDEAVKGVSAIVHVATIATFDPDPSTVIPQTIAGMTSILHAARKEPSVRRFVYTSSIVAGTTLTVGNTTHVGRDTWNDAAVEAAWAPPPYEPSRGFTVYQASKVVGEREVWKFAAEKNPQFTVNVVCPQTIIGELVGSHAQSFTANIIPTLYNNGDITSVVPILPAMYAVDVKDVALLHIAATLDPDVSNARLQAWGRNSTWNDLLGVLRKLYPNREFAEDLADPPRLSITTDESEPIALLKKWANQDGWRPLELTVKDNVDSAVSSV